MIKQAVEVLDEDAPQSQARLNEGWLFISTLLLCCIPVVGIIYAFSIPSYFGYAIWGEQASLAVLGLALSATFLIKPATRNREKMGGLPALDKFCSLISFGLCLWAAIRYEWLVSIGYLGAGADFYINLTVAALTLLLILEALRRLTGWAMVILVGTCLVYASVAGDMPGAFQGQTPDIDFLLGYLHLDSAGILGTPLAVVVSTVIAYILLGNALFRLGGGQLFLDLPLAVMGRYTGGPAKASVLASSLFGSISGSAVANVATSGIVTIPLMKKSGYTPTQAAAIEAVGSTGGQLLPPIMGAAAFIMAEFLGIPFAQVALAALVPAILFYLALMVQIHLHAARQGMRPVTAEERPDAMKTLRRYWPFLTPLIMLFVLLFAFRWSPERAAFASIMATLIAAKIVGEHSIGWRALLKVLESTGRSLLEIVTITAAAGIIVGVLSLTGLSFSLGLTLASIVGAPLLLLAITAIAAIVFGMGMPTTAVYVLMATLVAPALVAAGFDPLASHLFVLYFGVLSMITPPVCLASFAAASLARAPFMRTGWESMRFGAVAFIVPFVFVAQPALLLQEQMSGAQWQMTAVALFTAIFGFMMVAAAIEGYLFRRLQWLMRVLMAVAGVLLLIPDGGPVRIFGAIPTDMVGIVMGATLVLLNWWLSKNVRPGALTQRARP